MGVVIRSEPLVCAVVFGLGQRIGDRLDGGCDRCVVRRLRSGAGDGAGRRGAAPGGGGGGLGGPRRGGPLERRRRGGLRPRRPRGPGAERAARPVRGRGRDLGRDGGIRKGAVHGGGQIEGGTCGRTCGAWRIYRICGVFGACGIFRRIFRIRGACGIRRAGARRVEILRTACLGTRPSLPRCSALAHPAFTLLALSPRPSGPELSSLARPAPTPRPHCPGSHPSGSHPSGPLPALTPQAPLAAIR